jgi:hypothetical protein
MRAWHLVLPLPFAIVALCAFSACSAAPDAEEHVADREEEERTESVGSELHFVCSRHAQCASDVCDLYARPGWLPGRCVAETNLVYVDRNRCTAVADGSRARPFCEIRDAVRSPLRGSRAVRVYPGRYAPLGISVAVTIYGPAGEGGEALVDEEDISGLMVNPGGAAVLDGLSLGQTTIFGVRCRGASSALTVRRSLVRTDIGVGVIAEDGCTVTVDRSLVTGLRGGIALTDARYRITNTVVRNASERVAVAIAGGSGRFAYNTIVSNVTEASLGRAGGVQCTGGALLENSIVAQNGRDSTSGSQIEGDCLLRRVVLGRTDTHAAAGAIRLDPDLVGFRLPRTPRNAACCIDRGPWLDDVLFDHDGRIRPRGRAWDLGASETP